MSKSSKNPRKRAAKAAKRAAASGVSPGVVEARGSRCPPGPEAAAAAACCEARAWGDAAVFSQDVAGVLAMRHVTHLCHAGACDNLAPDGGALRECLDQASPPEPSIIPPGEVIKALHTLTQSGIVDQVMLDVRSSDGTPWFANVSKGAATNSWEVRVEREVKTDDGTIHRETEALKQGIEGLGKLLWHVQSPGKVQMVVGIAVRGGTEDIGFALTCVDGMHPDGSFVLAMRAKKARPNDGPDAVRARVRAAVEAILMHDDESDPGAFDALRKAMALMRPGLNWCRAEREVREWAEKCDPGRDSEIQVVLRFFAPAVECL
jgi:hypothetical protein